jgi:ribosomal protein L7Ae-like RNA K-turn-binding protein
VDIVRSAAERDNVHLAILAVDAAANSVKKVAPLLKARGVTYLVGPAAIELGASVGRPAVAVVGVLDGKLADGILRAMGITGLVSEEER